MAGQGFVQPIVGMNQVLWAPVAKFQTDPCLNERKHNGSPGTLPKRVGSVLCYWDTLLADVIFKEGSSCTKKSVAFTDMTHGGATIVEC